MDKSEKAKAIAEKLMRKAKSCESIGSLEEALAFAQKADQLAMKHGFEVPDGSHEDEQFQHLYWEAIKYYQLDYAAVVAKLYGVAVLHHRKKTLNAYVKLVGKLKNIALVMNFHEAILPKIESAMAQAIKEYKLENAVKHGEDFVKSTRFRSWLEKFRKSFYVGVALALRKRIEESREKYNSEIAGLIKNDLAEAKAFMLSTEKFRTSTKSTSGMNQNAIKAGIKAGSKASAGNALGGQKRLY